MAGAFLALGVTALLALGLHLFGCWLGSTISRRLDRSVRSDFWGGA